MNKSHAKTTLYDKLIPSIWLLGALIYIILLYFGNKKINQKIQDNFYEDCRINTVLEKCKNSIGIKRDIKLVLQDFKKTPSIIGIFNPKILVTKEFVQYHDEAIKFVLMHELAHYKRKDMLLNYILIIVTILHWFNPFVWICFKKIRQDMELAADELVIKHLEKQEQKNYGLTLIQTLQVFQEENYTAKILCVTDDSKNMERRIRMIKLSDKFSKNKVLISVFSILIIVTILGVFFVGNTKTEIVNTPEITDISELAKCQYKLFVPNVRLLINDKLEYYDFTEDMVWENSIYHKKINNYEEYLIVKQRWNGILDMNESDFQDYFMVLTTVENKSMLGLNVDNIETDENTIYISLKLEGEIVEVDEEHDGKMTRHTEESGISYKIPRTMERENIECIRNLRDDEKNFEEHVKIGETTILPNSYHFPFQYLTVEYTESIKKYSSSSSKFTILQPEWKDFISKDFVITKDMPDINFENWNSLGDDFYSLEITDFSEYSKLINNYNVKSFSWKNFENIYAIAIVRANSKNSIRVDNIKIDENGSPYVPVNINETLNAEEDIRYPGIILFVPNYRSLDKNHLKIKYEPNNNN